MNATEKAFIFSYRVFGKMVNLGQRIATTILYHGLITGELSSTASFRGIRHTESAPILRRAKNERPVWLIPVFSSQL